MDWAALEVLEFHVFSFLILRSYFLLQFMFEVKAKLSRDEFEVVENLIFESEGIEHWNLYENFDNKGYWVQGVFETETEAIAGKTEFEGLVEIAGNLALAELEDKDWKESYKEHFKPWHGNDGFCCMKNMVASPSKTCEDSVHIFLLKNTMETFPFPVESHNPC